MRVAVYNSHLRTLGGGEQHALAIVRWLGRQGFDVDVLARPGITLDECEARLGVRLPHARLMAIADDPIEAEREATARSSGYDLFVNATYASGAPNLAPRGALLVYFPIPPGDLPVQDRDVVQAWAETARHRPLGWIENDHGLYPAEPDGAWSDGRASYVLRLSRPGSARVHVVLGSPRPPGVAPAVATFHLDGRLVGVKALPQQDLTSLEVPLPATRTRGHRHRFDIRTTRFNLADAGLGDDRRDLGAFVHKVELTCGNWDNDLVEYGWRLGFLETYDLVLANSRYTAGWVRTLWGQSADVLYPPVTPPRGNPPQSRAPSIVALGRFFEGSHSKKQLELVQAFVSLCDGGLDGWRLVLLGGVDERDRSYLDRVRAAGEGYPVEVIANAPRDTVVRELGQASLFWQATGWGEDPERRPERFEHFGIALVEAMGAGAVPVVLHGGAADEVVRHDVDGLLWTADEGPGPATLALAGDPARRIAMAREARRRARLYSPRAFDRRLRHLLAPLLYG